MSITEFSIKNNRISYTALIVLVLAGIGTYNKMPRNEDPGFTVRVASVVTIFPGASPERMELLVSDPLEKVIQEIPELDFVTSDNKTGISTIFVNIKESEKEMRPIWDNLRRKINKAKTDLPVGIINPSCDVPAKFLLAIPAEIRRNEDGVAQNQAAARERQVDGRIVPRRANGERLAGSDRYRQNRSSALLGEFNNSTGYLAAGAAVEISRCDDRATSLQ